MFLGSWQGYQALPKHTKIYSRVLENLPRFFWACDSTFLKQSFDWRLTIFYAFWKAAHFLHNWDFFKKLICKIQRKQLWCTSSGSKMTVWETSSLNDPTSRFGSFWEWFSFRSWFSLSYFRETLRSGSGLHLNLWVRKKIVHFRHSA